MQPRVALIKVESVEGVDSAPTSANAVNTIDFSIKRYGGDRVSRNLDRQVSGNQEEMNTSPNAEASFKIEATGSGDAVTPVAYRDILLACGLSEVVDATNNKVTYTVDDDEQDSVTVWEFDAEAGTHQKLTGVRGAIKLSMSKGQLPTFEFSQFRGSYSLPVAGLPPTGIDWSAWKAPLSFTKDNVPVFTLDGYPVGVESFDLDWGNEIPWIDVPNYKSSKISDRKPSGSITIFAPKITDKNYFEKLESHNGSQLVPFALQLGVIAGQIIEVGAQQLQLGDITEGESDKIRTYTIPFKLIDNPVLTTR